MKRKKILHIYDPIFRQNYYYITCKTHKEYCQILKKEAGMNDEPKEGIDGHCSVFESNDNHIIVLWTTEKRPDLVAHEVMHGAGYVLMRKGIKFSDETEEIYCYLIQFIMRNIFGPSPVI